MVSVVVVCLRVVSVVVVVCLKDVQVLLCVAVIWV